MEGDKGLNLTVPPTGEIIFGKKIIELQDLSKGVYVTDNLDDLSKYVDKEKLVFQNVLEISVYRPEDTLRINQGIEPIAKCNLKRHPIINELLRRNNHPMSLPDFTAFLKALKNYAGPTTLSVLDNLNDLKIKKIISIQNKSDNRGNFAIGIIAESGKQDYKFPEQITFNVPLLENNSHIVEVPFDFQFTWKMEEQNAVLEFRLVNFEFEMQLNDKVYSLVAEKLKDNFVYRGSFNIIKKTDDFKYRESDIRL